MSVRLFARGSDGKVIICNGGISDATLQDYLSKPRKNIANIHFHSSLNYMSLLKIVTATVSFPARYHATETSGGGKKGSTTYDVPRSGTASYSLASHNLGYVPFATTARGSSQVTPTSAYQKVGPSFRVLNLSMDGNSVSINESYLTYKYDLPAADETFTVWIFRDPS